MSEFTDRLKAQAEIGKIIGEFVELRPNGQGWAGLCPFHGEKTPSFHVHAAKRYYYCFGCHASGDVYRFLMELRKLTFPEAVASVAERLGVPVPRERGEEADAERAPLLRIHAAAAEFFMQALKAPDGARARAYLRERELTPEALAGFQVGYAPDAGGRSLALWLEHKGFDAALALRAGLCQPRRESGERGGAVASTLAAAPGAAPAWPDLRDRFWDRVMFPIADERGQIIAFGGRRLAEGAEADRRGPKYLNSPESPLYVKSRVLYNLHRARDGIRELEYFLLVEGYFDCIRLYLAGFHNVVAICGTALTSNQVKPLARQARRAVINFDPDRAGSAAAERSIGLLLEENLEVRVVTLAGGLDPDLYVRRHGAEGYRQALAANRSFFDYLADRAQAQFDLRRPEGKLAALNHLLPYVSRIHDPILRQGVAENLAARLAVQQPVVSRQLLRAVQERRSSLSVPEASFRSLLMAEQVVLRAWLEWEERRAELSARIAAEGLWQGLVGEPLIERLIELAAQGMGVAEMTEHLPPADRHLIATLLMSPADAEPLSEGLLEEALEMLRQRRQAQAQERRTQTAARAGDKAMLQERLLRERAARGLAAGAGAGAATPGSRNPQEKET